jgi:hypothetical protein
MGKLNGWARRYIAVLEFHRFDCLRNYWWQTQNSDTH